MKCDKLQDQILSRVENRKAAITSYVNCCLYLSVLLGLRRLNKQTERLQRADRNVLEHKVAVGRQRQSFDNRLGFFNRCGVHKEDHATGLILAEPELIDLAVEIEPQSVGDFLRQEPLPLLVRERLGKQTQSKNLHDCSPCSSASARATFPSIATA